jgi:OOP family OmpA-OmpF porin
MQFNTLIPSVFLLAAVVVPPVETKAQMLQTTSDSSLSPKWYIGLGGGVNISSLQYSDLDESLFPENNSNLSGVFSVFAECDFGKQSQFAVRPQFSFLSRGGKLTDIGRDYFADYEATSDLDRISDVYYQLKANYFDFRLPLIYQFGRIDWRIRPYLYVAPIVGFVHSGFVDARYKYADKSYEGVRYGVSKANINSMYFAGAAAVGAKWQFDIGESQFFLGVEASYQMGFSDTYSSDEKDGKVENVVSFFPTSGKVEGTRKINAWEISANLGIPLSAFKKKHKVPVTPVVVETPAPVVKEPEPVVEERPCYTLDEVVSMLNSGQNVEGKVICAIDDNINFEFGKSDIKSSSYSYLNTLADLFKRTNMHVRINGHTDDIGSAENNMELSRKRAQAVMKYLIDKGVNSENLSCAWYGFTRPIASNETEEGRKQNRRVEFEILN